MMKNTSKRYFHPKLRCVVVSLSYDFVTQTGEVDMEAEHYCNMDGAIAFFRKIDPNVKQIETFAGGEPATVYTRQGKTGTSPGEWTASLPYLDLTWSSRERVELACRDAGHKKRWVIPDDRDLDTIAAEGKVVLLRTRNEYFGGPTARDFLSPTLVNPTWLEIMIEANRSIPITNDYHHVFFEGINEIEDPSNTYGEPGVTVYQIWMGS